MQGSKSPAEAWTRKEAKAIPPNPSTNYPFLFLSQLVPRVLGLHVAGKVVQVLVHLIQLVPVLSERTGQIPQGFKAVGVKPKATIRKPVTGTALSQEKIDMIKQMSRDGKTVKEICDYTGVSEPTVRKYKKEVCDETTEPAAEGVSED